MKREYFIHAHGRLTRRKVGTASCNGHRCIPCGNLRFHPTRQNIPRLRHRCVTCRTPLKKEFTFQWNMRISELEDMSIRNPSLLIIDKKKAMKTRKYGLSFPLLIQFLEEFAIQQTVDGEFFIHIDPPQQEVVVYEVVPIERLTPEEEPEEKTEVK